MEFVDVVQEALERDGTFQQLRAQLRAAVQRIVENKGGKPHNPRLISFAGSDHGLIALCLVKDVLERAGLEQTLLALNAEAGEHLNKKSREHVAKQYGLNGSQNMDASLLVQLLESGGRKGTLPAVGSSIKSRSPPSSPPKPEAISSNNSDDDEFADEVEEELEEDILSAAEADQSDEPDVDKKSQEERNPEQKSEETRGKAFMTAPSDTTAPRSVSSSASAAAVSVDGASDASTAAPGPSKREARVISMELSDDNGVRAAGINKLGQGAVIRSNAGWNVPSDFGSGKGDKQEEEVPEEVEDMETSERRDSSFEASSSPDRNKFKESSVVSKWANDEDDDYAEFEEMSVPKSSLDRLKGSSASQRDADDIIDAETTLRPSGSRIGLIPLNSSKSMKDLPPLNANKNDRQSGWGAPKSPQSEDRAMDMDAEQHSDRAASEEEEEYSMEEEGVEDEDDDGGFREKHSQSHKSESEDDEEEDYFGGVSKQKSIEPTVAKSNASSAPVKSLFSVPTSKPAPKPVAAEDYGYGDDFEDYGDDFEDDGFMSSDKAKSSSKPKPLTAPDSEEIEEDIEEDISVGAQEESDDSGFGSSKPMGGYKPSAAYQPSSSRASGTTRTSGGAANSEDEERDRLADLDRKLAALESKDNSLKNLRSKSKFENKVSELSDSVTSDDGLSVGGADSESDSFLTDSVGASRGSTRKANDRGGRSVLASSQSIEFSVTEQEVFDSQVLEDFDYTTNAVSPKSNRTNAKRSSGW